MFKNYMFIALRNLWKQKIYTSINVIGLSIGIGCTIVVYFFIRSEMTYDQFHPDNEHIYRVAMAVNFRGLEYWTTSPYRLAAAIEAEVPGIERVTRWSKAADKQVRIGPETFDDDIYLTNAAFFDMFHFPLLSGDPEQILSDPNTLIISTRMKEVYFPDTDPVGKTLFIQLRGDTFSHFQIAGVAAPIPENSSIRFDILLSDLIYQEVFGAKAMNGWFPKTTTITFVQTQPNMHFETFNQNLNRLADAYQPEGTTGWGKKLGMGNIEQKLRAQLLRDIHFDTEIKFTSTILAPAGDPSYMYILSGIALIILAIACINFMNLAMGLSTRRTREVGLRKILGAERLQLMKQFWTESVIVCVFAIGLGLGVAELILPTFNELSGKYLDLDYLSNPVTMGMLACMALVVGLVAGMYPALVLSGLEPVKIIRDAVTLGGGHIFFKAMVVLQFGLSIFLITSTLLINRQLNHVTDFDLGMNPENVIYQRLTKRIGDQVIERYRQAVIQHHNVANVASASATLFGESTGRMWKVTYQGERTMFPLFKVSHDFLDVMEIPLVAGRNLSRERPADQAHRIIVNERFIKEFGLKDPIDHVLPFEGGVKPVIIGVVPNFHFQSLRHAVIPMAMYLRTDNAGAQQILIKLASDDHFSETIQFLQETWNRQAPEAVFDYALLVEELRNQYRTEARFQQIMSMSSYFGIVIACLGLFGMTSLSVARRTKEMGIRKVMGASSRHILSLFNREYLWLILLANILAWPVAYYAMRDWLRTFIYRVALDPTVFLMAGTLALALAIATISIQALRVVRLNPVTTLRDE